MSNAVDCGDLVFNSISEQCVSETSSLGKLVNSIDEKLIQMGQEYFSKGCTKKTIKNPLTKYCIKTSTALGKTILDNVTKRVNGILACTPPRSFNTITKRCWIDPNPNSCAAYDITEHEFIPHDEQIKVANWFINTNNRGIVLFHGLGSGKTCTSILMIDMWLQRHPDRKVYIYLPASLRSNFLKEYCSKCGKNVDVVKDKFHFVSYNYTSNRIHLPTKEQLKDNLVVVDEFHKIILGMISQGIHYTTIYKSLYESNLDKIICLSGTPETSSPLEIYYEVNMCKNNPPFKDGTNYLQNVVTLNSNRKWIPKNRDEFIKDIHGVYSYLPSIATINGLNGYPVVTHVRKYVPMLIPQYIQYAKAKSGESPRGKPNPKKPDYERQRMFYFIRVSMLRSRQRANMYYPPNVSDNDMIKNISKVSPKFTRIINYIKNNVGKQVVYSQFKERYGVQFLSDALNYMKIPNLLFTGDFNDTQRLDILAKFNNENNNNGNYYKVLLLTDAGSQGLNLFGARALHIVEQTVSPNVIQQIEGRVVRFGGHLMLPLENRNITIISYFALTPGIEIKDNEEIQNIPLDRHTSDFDAHRLANDKSRSVSVLLHILKSQPLIPE